MGAAWLGEGLGVDGATVGFGVFGATMGGGVAGFGPIVGVSPTGVDTVEGVGDVVSSGRTTGPVDRSAGAAVGVGVGVGMWAGRA
ncbi:MAG: hypothetical protein Q8R28_12150 [Dehalococcoidia bacterium]|nr:hypothetical protein [Dehalococcoidia bacterium]